MTRLNFERMRYFNKTTDSRGWRHFSLDGLMDSSTWVSAATHPDRCACQGQDFAPRRHHRGDEVYEAFCCYKDCLFCTGYIPVISPDERVGLPALCVQPESQNSFDLRPGQHPSIQKDYVVSPIKAEPVETLVPTIQYQTAWTIKDQLADCVFPTAKYIKKQLEDYLL